MSHFILADCNNFYISCERLFNPALDGKPVIALSQNDGCIISRSQEAKQLGIKMGEPYFKIKNFCERAKVIVYSSNYQLYGDISERVMNVLTQLAPEIEVYSIDEAFLKFPKTIPSDEMYRECIEIKRIVKKWVGIPVSIGLAPTKTLAKVANDLAKKKNRVLGVCNLNCPLLREEILKEYPTGDVWGIGSRLSQRLRNAGIFTAWDFIQMDPYYVRKKMGVVGERMLWELRGVSTLDLQVSEPRKNISFTRSFGRVVTEISDLAEALSTFTSKACVKLRNQNSYASAIQVFLEAVSYERDEMVRRYYGMVSVFPKPTNDTPQMISAAKSCLKKLYDDQEKYKKCGIFLLDLIAEENVVPDLFLGGVDSKRNTVMHTVDALNERFGKNTVFFGAAGIDQSWKSRSEQRSKHNTTSWGHLPLAFARK